MLWRRSYDVPPPPIEPGSEFSQDGDPRYGDLGADMPATECLADVVKRFVTAMEQSLDYAQANPDAVREILGEYTQIPPEAIANIKLPQWRKDITLDTVELLSQLSLEYGLIESEPDLNELIAD